MKISKLELAETLGVSTRTVHKWMKEGILPYRKIGRRVLFDPAEIEQTLQRDRRPAYREPKRRMVRIKSPELPTK